MNVFDLRGWYVEGIERIEAVIQGLGTKTLKPKDKGALAMAFTIKGWFQFRSGQLNNSRQSFEQSLTLAQQVEDPLILMEAYSLSSPVLASLGEVERSIQYASAGIEAAHASGNQWSVGSSRLLKGGILARLGMAEEALAYTTEALEIFRTVGDYRLTISSLNTLALVSLRLARFAEARKHLQEGMSLLATHEDRWNLATLLGYLGLVELAEGHFTEAESAFNKSIPIFADLGNTGDVALYLAYLGDVAALRNMRDEAENHYIDSLRMAREVNAAPLSLGAIIRLAQLHIENEKFAPDLYERALYVSSHPAALLDSKKRAEKMRADLETKLSPRQIKAAQAHLPAVTLDSVTKEILQGRHGVSVALQF
jgi:tetratricopeptide (TPR) repeat protein